MKLILASESPRRREILQSAGLVFSIVPAQVEELMTGPDLAMLPEENAGHKAAWVFDRHPDCAVIGADTVIMFENEIIGKPRDSDDAFAILSRLSGHRHQVLTGVAVIGPGIKKSFTVTSDIVFKPYDQTVIRQYLRQVHVLDKAGAYAIQHRGFQPVEHLNGCYASVMGLPLCHISRGLRQLDIVNRTGVAAECQSALEYACPVFSSILEGKEPVNRKGKE